ncbi:MAG: hypothetical protein D3X82_17245 [Candidatus Leucobacter sulfamidivorax]|nr:hypothetical protein [Candidatus Leucobacter sulfamidivorax]
MSATVQARSSIEHPEAVFFGPRPGYGRELWAVLSIATVAAVMLTWWQVGADARILLAGVGLIAAAGAAMLPRGARLPAPWAWGAATTAALLVLFTTIWDPAHGQVESYAPWYARGATVVCAAVILRRRAGAGWTGALVGYSGALVVDILSGEPFEQWVDLVVRQAAALIAIQVFAVLLVRGQEAIAALRDEERARLTAIRLRETVVRQRHVETERIRNLVTSTLQRIAVGDTSPELRREALLLEGELRDALRGRRLAAGSVPSAARAARARGVDVVLLDDLGDPGEGSMPEAVPAAALDWVASRLSAAAPPRATLRLAVGADGRPAISFYAENSDDPPEFLALDPAEPPPRIRPEGRGRAVSPSSGRADR